MIKEIKVNEVITFEYPPDGGQILIIDPYDGCSIDCPYCFQQADEEWNKNLYIKSNLPELIKEQLADWQRDKTIYIGSRCDPYQKVEEKYELTRKCLIELSKLEIPVMIVTKAHHELLLRDISIIKDYPTNITVLIGLSNLKQLKEVDDGTVVGNVNLANHLNNEGIEVWAFITPVLTGITNVKKMIQALSPSIPIFLDKLRIEKNTKIESRMTNYIARYYPNLISTYKNIISKDKDEYINNLKEIYSGDERVKFIFD